MLRKLVLFVSGPAVLAALVLWSRSAFQRNGNAAMAMSEPGLLAVVMIAALGGADEGGRLMWTK